MEVSPILLQSQLDFLEATNRETLFSSGFGGGKSYSLCWKLYMRASEVGAREGLCRKHLVNLKGSTLKTLLEGDGMNPPVIPLGTYEHNQSEKTIKIKGGGSIVYFGIDEPEKIGSLNLSGCGIDEAAELTLEDWLMIDGRCRLRIPHLQNQVYAATNPRHPSHWMAKRFGLDGGRGQEQCRVILANSLENHFLPVDYVKSLERREGVDRDRNVYGKWIGAEGLVFSNFEPSEHVRECPNLPSRCIVGIDDGYVHPFAALAIHVDSDSRIHVSQEFYKSGIIDVTERAKAAIALAPNAEAYVYDHSAADLGEAIRNLGVRSTKADKSRTEGFDKLRSRFTVQPDGKPRITIDPSCRNLIRELLSIEYEKDSERIRKVNDDAVDALRYAAMYLDGGSRSYVYSGGIEEKATINANDKDLSLFERMRLDPEFGWN